MLKTIGTYLGILVVGIVIGVLTALLTMSQHKAIEVTKEARAVVATTAQNVVKSVADDERVQAKVDTQNQSADAAKAVVQKDMKPQKEVVYVQVQVPGKTEVQTCPAVDGDTAVPLSVGSVRLLNDLRAYRTVDLTKLDTSESQAPAGVTFAAFVGNDIDVVKLYNELATEHDELVDQVKAYMAKQAKQAAASK